MIEKIKDYFTDIIGAVIMLLTVYGVWISDTINLLWEGVIGLSVGFILLALPDGVLAKILVNWFKKKF